MAKDKKKKVKKSKRGKSAGSQSLSVAERFKAISENPAVAEFVSSALLATAAALRDPSKVRRAASSAGGELSDLVKEGAERGHALWEMALQVGRRGLDNLTDDKAPRKRAAAKRAPAKRAPSKRAPAKRAPARKTAATKAPAKKPAATATARKSPAKKAATRQAPAAKSAARKPAVRKAPARKPAPRRAPRTTPRTTT